jgi:hypothetical protein
VDKIQIFSKALMCRNQELKTFGLPGGILLVICSVMAAEQGYSIISKGGVGELSIFDAKREYVTVFSYKGWLSRDGSAPTTAGVVEVRTKNQRTKTFSIWRDDTEIGELAFQFRGNLTLKLPDFHGSERELVLRNDEEKMSWILEDENGTTVLTMTSDTSWAKVDQRYEVVILEDLKLNRTELLIACGYATNLNTAMIAALMA